MHDPLALGPGMNLYIIFVLFFLHNCTIDVCGVSLPNTFLTTSVIDVMNTVTGVENWLLKIGCVMVTTSRFNNSLCKHFLVGKS